MKYKSTIVIIISLVILNSCASTNDNPGVQESYGLIYSSFQLSKDEQQKFIDKCTESLNAIKNNDSVKIDTKELMLLLDSAKSGNQKSLSMVTIAADIDTTKYKEKALKYLNLLNRLYNHEFKEYINILDTPSKNQYEKASKLLYTPLIELQKLGKEFSDASTAIREKYHIQLIDTSKNSIN